MLKIKKTREGHYMATLEHRTEELDRYNSNLIKKELSMIIKPHREITVDMKGVYSMNIGAYKIIQELVNKANAKKCKIVFINAEPFVSTKLSFLNSRRLKTREELETDML
ncbi:STAS domain-containing protein [Draconibacterium mangrovi]|uniref:STAS domain-containing protein n=1 Tax=Draconibacterium mangrovi TaxID=2697469 RepID=UPI0013D4B8D7|nr:STAS domain-containing protein [Draconibacterium mangrovi]